MTATSAPEKAVVVRDLRRTCTATKGVFRKRRETVEAVREKRLTMPLEMVGLAERADARVET